MTFMKSFWAALLAFVAANIILLILLAVVMAGFAAFMAEPVPVVKKNSVLLLDLSNGIDDSPDLSPLIYSGFGEVRINRSNTILEAVSAIQSAAVDSNVDGIFIDLAGGGSVSLANLEELRAALIDFRNSGKFIVSYGDSYSQLGYYLSSVADKVVLNPRGDITWNGLASSVMFYKGLLDKLGVEAEILRHGSFKSAAEPLMYEQMSPENREQLNALLYSVWGAILHDVSVSRGIDSAVLSNYATELSLRSADDALEYGFADALLYKDQVMELLGRLSTGDESIDEALAEVQQAPEAPTEEQTDLAVEEPAVAQEPELISLSDYIMTGGSSSAGGYSENEIALIYADGDIVDGESPRGSVGSATLSQKIADARRDENVRAIVLRVNSPGGSALASEVICREMSLAKEVKPVIVSMGGVAASGGYYISCPADLVIAGRTTLTGSIGVFGVMMDVSRGLRDKLGITVDVARTNPSADAGSLFRKLSPNEREAFMSGIENVYSTFVERVAQGRNMSVDDVDKIAQGRVWSGADAAAVGLVDAFGGISQAITLAADRAGVGSDYTVVQMTDAPESLVALLRSLGGIFASQEPDPLAEMLIQYNSLKNMITQQKGIQARMPYMLDIQ